MIAHHKQHMVSGSAGHVSCAQMVHKCRSCLVFTGFSVATKLPCNVQPDLLHPVFAKHLPCAHATPGVSPSHSHASSSSSLSSANAAGAGGRSPRGMPVAGAFGGGAPGSSGASAAGSDYPHRPPERETGAIPKATKVSNLVRRCWCFWPHVTSRTLSCISGPIP